MIHRRSFLTGLGALIAAPAIVRAGSLMPVRGVVMDSGQMTLEEYSRRILGPMHRRMEAELVSYRCQWQGENWREVSKIIMSADWECQRIAIPVGEWRKVF